MAFKAVNKLIKKHFKKSQHLSTACIAIIMLMSIEQIRADELEVPSQKPDLRSVPPFYSNIVHQQKEHQHNELIHEITQSVSSPALNDALVYTQASGLPFEKPRRQFCDPFLDFFADQELNQEKVDLSLVDCTIQEVIELIGSMIGINFIVDPDVRGGVGKVMFQDCTPGHILHVVCMSNTPQLTLVKELDVWRIMLLSKALEYYKAQHEQQYIHDVIPVRFTKFDDKFKKEVDELFKRLQTEKDDRRAYIVQDNQVRKVFIYGPKAVVRQLKKYIQEIDVRGVQVRIDAVIVIADKRCEFSFGFDWSGIYNRLQTLRLKEADFGFVGTGGTLRDFANRIKHVAPVPFAFNLVTKGKQFINLPFVFGGPNLNTRRLNLVLRAAEADSKLKIISRPSVLTYNLECAEILVGNNIPIQTIVEDVIEGKLRNVDTVNYKDVGTMIKVTPSVNLETNSVLMDIIVEDSQVVDFEQFVESKDRLRMPPIIKTIRTKNKVELYDGATTVIGGLCYDKKDVVHNQVPFLSRIPIFGPIFFKFRAYFQRDVEQLIFITPHIVGADGTFDEQCCE